MNGSDHLGPKRARTTADDNVSAQLGASETWKLARHLDQVTFSVVLYGIVSPTIKVTDDVTAFI